MRHRLLTALAVAGLAAAGIVAAAPAASAANPEPRPQQHGRWLVDPDGRVLVLQGVNMVNKVGSYAPSATGFDADDAAFLAEQGFTTVRLGLIWKAVEPSPGQYDDAYLANVRRTTELLANQGIWTMLDFHQDMYNEKFQGEGAPDWAVQDGGLPAAPQLGFPYNYFGMPAVNRAYDRFWANAAGPGGIGLQDRYAQAWRHVAEFFASTPKVMGFDLFNEPWPGTTYPVCINPLGCPGPDRKLSAFSQRAVDAIRTVDPNTVAYYEPQLLFSEAIKTSVKVTGANLGFSFHNYCVFDPIAAAGLGLEKPACGITDSITWSNMEQHVSARSVSPLLTEFGATDNLTTLQDMVARAAKHRIGWQYWAYCGCSDPTTTGAGDSQALVLDPRQPPTGSNVKEAKLKALAVPHPTAVAGTPTSYDFDRATGVFTLKYSSSKAGGTGSFAAESRTTVAVPRIQYPGGYTVTATGATVASATDAPQLVLALKPGVTQVQVTVKKR